MRTAVTVLMLAAVTFSACGQRSAKMAETAVEPQGKVVKLDTEDFLSRVYNYRVDPDQWNFRGDKPAVVDFYADWCGPCKQIAPIMDKLADEYAGRVDIYKVDIDDEQELAQAFGITSIPLVIFIPVDGEPQMKLGAMREKQYRELIDEMLGDK